ncbi:MAG: hypothetical protein QOH10_2339 [Actinomycetota bacterium]|nr:hypothetical protein [Actinomycetota bacterium]
MTNLEEELRNIGPALDRAIDEATDGVSPSALTPRARHSWSGPRAAMAALVAAAVVAAVVGVVTRLDTGGRHGIATIDSTAASSSSTPPTTAPTTTWPPTTTGPPNTRPGVALRSVRWASVVYPMHRDCGNVMNPPVSVGQVAYPAPTAGVQVAVVLVRCTVGAGTPPVVVYVYDRATSARAPHLAQTLVTDTDGWQAGSFTARDATIALPVSGFSSNSLPNCCPDVRTTLRWRWTSSSYQLVSAIPPHIKYPW